MRTWWKRRPSPEEGWRKPLRASSARCLSTNGTSSDGESSSSAARRNSRPASAARPMMARTCGPSCSSRSRGAPRSTAAPHRSAPSSRLCEKLLRVERVPSPSRRSANRLGLDAARGCLQEAPGLLVGQREELQRDPATRSLGEQFRPRETESEQRHCPRPGRGDARSRRGASARPNGCLRTRARADACARATRSTAGWPVS